MLLSLCIFAGGSEETAKKQTTITDCTGREVAVPLNAESFVAIGPGSLRLYCYVGDTSRIVGIEQFEVIHGVTGKPYLHAHPQLLELPIIGSGGPGSAPDPEKLLEIYPDIIFSTHTADTKALDELQNKTGIPVIALSYGETEVFDPMISKSLELIGFVTGRSSRAEEVVRFIDACAEDLHARSADVDAQERPTIYLGAQSMRGSHGIESTRGNYPVFSILNARNVVAEGGISSYVMLDREILLDWDPDIIVLDAAGLANVQADYSENLPFYQALSAFRNGRVYLQLPYNNYHTNIGIALGNAYFTGTILYPDRFADIDIAEKANEIFGELLGEKLYGQTAEEYFGGYQRLTFNGK